MDIPALVHCGFIGPSTWYNSGKLPGQLPWRVFILQWEQNINTLLLSWRCIFIKISENDFGVHGPPANSLQWLCPVWQLGWCCSSRGLHCLIWHACGKCFDIEKMALNLNMAFNFYQEKELQMDIFTYDLKMHCCQSFYWGLDDWLGKKGSFWGLSWMKMAVKL